MHGTNGVFPKVTTPLTDQMVLDTINDWLGRMEPGEVLDKAGLEYLFWRPFLPDHNAAGEHYKQILVRLIKEGRIITFKWDQMPATFRFRYAANRGHTTPDHLKALAQTATPAQAAEIEALLARTGHGTGATFQGAPAADEEALKDALFKLVLRELNFKPAAKFKELVEALAERGLAAPAGFSKKDYLALAEELFGTPGGAVTAPYRTDRTQPLPEPSYPVGRVVDPDNLAAGDRFTVLKPLIDTADGHAGAAGTVLWTDGNSPCVQLGDGTVLNLIEDDCIDRPRTAAARRGIELITISHDRSMWNEGFDRPDIYLRFPVPASAPDLEAAVRMLVDAHNKAQTGYDRTFKVSVRRGLWEGPDLEPVAALKILVEALNEWKGL
jgi:hypothetical protein